jgi:hypothetical protein
MGGYRKYAARLEISCPGGARRWKICAEHRQVLRKKLQDINGIDVSGSI